MNETRFQAEESGIDRFDISWQSIEKFRNVMAAARTNNGEQAVTNDGSHAQS